MNNLSSERERAVKGLLVKIDIIIFEKYIIIIIYNNCNILIIIFMKLCIIYNDFNDSCPLTLSHSHSHNGVWSFLYVI